MVLVGLLFESEFFRVYQQLHLQVLQEFSSVGSLGDTYDFSKYLTVSLPSREFPIVTRKGDDDLLEAVRELVEGRDRVYTWEITQELSSDMRNEDAVGQVLSKLGWFHKKTRGKNIWVREDVPVSVPEIVRAKLAVYDLPKQVDMVVLCEKFDLPLNANTYRIVGKELRRLGWKRISLPRRRSDRRQRAWVRNETSVLPRQSA
jgi:hypothetical protein